MKRTGFKIKSAIVAAMTMVFIIPAFTAVADEMLSIYGLKGYAFVNSPLSADGLHLQTGAMYSIFHERNLERRDGYIWVAPVSATYGDGKHWEIAAASHYEYWKNTDVDVDETGIGDVVVSGKFAPIEPEEFAFDFSLMPYVLIPTGDRDKSIGDIYRYSPGGEDDFSCGLNLLAGKRWNRLYWSVNAGVNYLDSSDENLKDTTFFVGTALEYQICEAMNSYVEFYNNENKLDVNCFDPCYDSDTNDDMREIGAGLVWLKDKWGLKFHMGYGLTKTSPDFRALALVNRTFSF